MPGPLHGVKVVEFTEVVAGPFAGMLLADMGAEVTKVEPPWGDPWRHTQSFMDGESRPFIAYNRGKRSLTLDLTSSESQDVLQRLIPQIDVVLVNYRPDVADKLGVDYETLAALNPRLIYCQITSFGSSGPDSHRPGYDLIVQAMSGLVSAEEKVQDGSPQQIWSTPLVDTAAGICLAWCVCGALYSRERTGRGQKVETTLMGMALAMLGMRFVQVEALDQDSHTQTLDAIKAMRAAEMSYEDVLGVYQAEHPPSPGGIYYRMYRTRDGAIAVGCLNDRLRHGLLDVLGLKDMRFDQDYDPNLPESIAFGDSLVQRVETLFAGKRTLEWLEILEKQGLPCGPVRFVEELFDDPQVVANCLVVQVEHERVGRIKMVGPLASFSGTPLEASAPPGLGQHTEEVLRELGYSEEETGILRDKGIIG